jgi:hypothetical protein
MLVGKVNCFWPSPAQSFLVLGPVGLMTTLLCLTTLGAMQLLSTLDISTSTNYIEFLCDMEPLLVKWSTRSLSFYLRFLNNPRIRSMNAHIVL